MPSTREPRPDLLLKRLEGALQRADQVAAELGAPEAARDPTKLKVLGREHARLEPIVRSGRRFLKARADLAAARELVASGDGDLAALAQEELVALEPEVAALEGQLAELLTPRDPLDDRDAIVEVRAGTGGDEAALFASELFRMYTLFAERRGLKTEIISRSEDTLGGLKEAIFAVRGPEAFGALRSEAGVHRVQRVPVTESAGRIHTSAATVAVLPEA